MPYELIFRKNEIDINNLVIDTIKNIMKLWNLSVITN